MPSVRTGTLGAANLTTTPGYLGVASDYVVPSMAVLRSSTEIQGRMNARLQEFERAAATFG